MALGFRAGLPGQTVSANLAGTSTGTGNGTRVLIEVRDADPQPPGPGKPGDGGAGDAVLLVAALSDLDLLRRLRDRLRS